MSFQVRNRFIHAQIVPIKINAQQVIRVGEYPPTEYEEIYQKADKLFAENIELYKQRQMIVEHPFGTIKKALGYTYFLTRGNENVKNKSCLHCFTYNLKRVINIMGVAPLLEAIKLKMVKLNKENTTQFYHFLRILNFGENACQFRIAI